MKLWILRPNPERKCSADPWREYDTAGGFIVRAPSEKVARRYAKAHQGTEGQTWLPGRLVETSPSPWEDQAMSTCEELTPDNGTEGVIMRDFRAG